MKQAVPLKLKGHTFLKGGGEMGKIIAGKDWSKHPLGPIEDWPDSLKSSLGICLHSAFPMAVYWGNEMYVFYNDARKPFHGDNHPDSLGKPARQVWDNIWDQIGPPLRLALNQGKGSVKKNLMLSLHHQELIEERYFDYTFNPIYEEDSNKPAGILNVGHEITSVVLAERRNKSFRRISEEVIVAESPEAASIMVANALSENPQDIPFGMIYLLSPDNRSLRLAASTIIDHPFAGTEIRLDDEEQLLPFKNIINDTRSRVVGDVGPEVDLPGGPWEEGCRDIAMLPIIHPSKREVYGVIVLGISPRLHYDESYKLFFSQLAEMTAFAIGAAVDIRQRQTMEAREREVQRQLQAALSGGRIGVWTWDIASDKLYPDKNLAKLFGLTPEKVEPGIPLAVLTDKIHPNDRKSVIKSMERAITDTKVFTSEYRVRVDKNDEKWLLARGKVEDDENGKPVRFPGVAVDITERKLMEDKLSKNERMFRGLFQSSILGIAVATTDGKVHDANETFLNMFGYGREDLKRGMSSRMINPASSANETAINYEELRIKGEVDPIEKNYRRKDGSIVPTLVGAVMVPGSKDRFVIFMLDISEQKRLAALNKAKDEFISIVSHQLRTPATGVKQYLGMLLEGYAGSFSKTQRKIMQTAYDSNERQLQIVNDILKVAQADAKEVKLKKIWVDMVDIIQSVIVELSPQVAQKNQKINFSHRRKKVCAFLDPLHARMIIENVLDNAHKYTPKNKSITISLTAGTKNIRVSIKDEGIGIRKRDMPKLFKKFSRIDNPLSTTAGGTGLGLYWVLKIIELHNGTITVNSNYKQGSEFVIILPTGVE